MRVLDEEIDWEGVRLRLARYVLFAGLILFPEASIISWRSLLTITCAFLLGIVFQRQWDFDDKKSEKLKDLIQRMKASS